MGLQFLFIDDNASCHRTVAAEQLLESRRLAARTLPPVTIRELRLALQDEWAAMPQQLIDTLILSTGRRCEICLEVREIISPTKDRMFLAGHPSQGCFGLQSHCAPCYFFNQASFYPFDFSFIGAVNFNILHTVLLTIINELRLHNIRPWVHIENPVLAKSALTKAKLEQKDSKIFEDMVSRGMVPVEEPPKPEKIEEAPPTSIDGGGRVRSTTPAEDRYIVLSAKGTGAPQLSRWQNQFLAASGRADLLKNC
ncbi:transposable element Tcb2 transposase [Trichonephila clavipes]|nr:transposable element Tcb2 transposase [Trichonephila clavipes]